MIDLKVIIFIHKTRTKTRSTTENKRTKDSHIRGVQDGEAAGGQRVSVLDIRITRGAEEVDSTRG